MNELIKSQLINTTRYTNITTTQWTLSSTSITTLVLVCIYITATTTFSSTLIHYFFNTALHSLLKSLVTTVVIQSVVLHYNDVTWVVVYCLLGTAFMSLILYQCFVLSVVRSALSFFALEILFIKTINL